VGEIIEDNDYGNYGNKLISGEHFLYMTSILVESLSPNYNSSVVLRKYEITTGIENKPIAIDLCNIYPNPSKANTTILYSLKETEHISIKIYDLQGNLINTLLVKKQTPGRYQIMWNGTDKNKKEVNSGLYLVRLQAGRQLMTRLVEIIK
jgi:flagellar hook assembly protein FlgD